jgi:tetratricopeptide (TPR) repeat protein
MGMCRLVSLTLLVLAMTTVAAAQVDQLPSSQKGPGQNQAPPRYDRSGEAGESSSRDTKIDISPPKDDAKSHPNSSSADNGANPSDEVQELHPWDPHKANKDIEVGDFYFKRKNYHAALERYREALFYKSGDAIANFRMAECMEKLGDPEEAANHYQEYLKILPHGQFSAESQKALQRLKGEKSQASEKHPPK